LSLSQTRWLAVDRENGAMLICSERSLVRLIVRAVVDLFRSRAAIEAEILTLWQQIVVLRRTAAKVFSKSSSVRERIDFGTNGVNADR
jgi:hypothetical protein